MLTAMQTAIDDGTMREEDVERLMVNYLSDPKNEGHEEFTRRTKREARLESKDLVNASTNSVNFDTRGINTTRAKNSPRLTSVTSRR